MVHSTNSLDSIIKFTKLLNDFRQTRRALLVVGEDRCENDVEHSYMLAMSAWHLIELHKLNLDLSLSIKYALVHDLPEVYTGDVSAFASKEEIDQNCKKEPGAIDKLQKEFPETEELHSLIAAYVSKRDEESKFIYALDKVLPMLNNYTDKGRSWKKDHITFDMMVNYKKDKVSLSKEVELVFKDLIKVLRDRESEFFNKK